MDKTTLTIEKWLSKDLSKLARHYKKEERRTVYKNEVIMKLVRAEMERLGL